MSYTYHTKGTCSTKITFELDGDVVRNVSFSGGCNGNLQAVSRLVEGLTVDELTKRVAGIRCGMKKTSCADQLAQAVLAAVEGRLDR